MVTIPTTTADVVRCSSCGAARQVGSAACSFCQADFIFHEQDLHTLCPHCVTRVSDRAKFCHSCGKGISPGQRAGEVAPEVCPVCAEDHQLFVRSLDPKAVTVLECDRCGGVWVGHQIFEILEEEAQSQMASLGRPNMTVLRPQQEGSFYRPCVACGKLMNRRNYGRRSGIVVDVCREHGLWFDQGELEEILDWVRSGGPREVEEKDSLEPKPLQRLPTAISPIPSHSPTSVASMLVRALIAFLSRR